MILVMNAIWIVATLALVPFLLFFVAITLAAYLGRPRLVDGLPTQSRSRFLIVIPAHDEAGVIGTTVRSCLALDYDPSLFSIYVIADNCTDSTADEAREAGASVVERSDPNSRSKGHALDYFFTHIPAGNPEAGHDATVIVDADTLVDPGLLRVFDRALVKGKDWLQGYYSVSNPDASWRTRMMTYAFSLANGVWMVGLDRLGLGVGLKGNGMCFSSRGLRRFPWKAHGLVEDMEFALMLRVQGERVSFEPEARVFGEMVSRGGAGAASQRRRWEVGRRSAPRDFRGTSDPIALPDADNQGVLPARSGLSAARLSRPGFPARLNPAFVSNLEFQLSLPPRFTWVRSTPPCSPVSFRMRQALSS